MNITTIGLDIVKNVFQVHGVDANGKIVLRKQLKRSQVLAFFAKRGIHFTLINTICTIYE